MSKHHHNHKKHHHSAVRSGMKATPERRRQLGGIETEVVDRDYSGKVYIERHRARTECVLDFYLRTRRINDRQHKAGMMFRAVYIRIDLGVNGSIFKGMPRVCAGVGHAEDKMLSHIYSVDQLKLVWEKMTPLQQTIVRNVCGYDEYAGSYNNRVTLVRGLDKLADLWHIS